MTIDMTSMMDNDDNHDDNPPETFFLLSRQHWGRILSVHSHQGWPDLIIAIMMLMIVISFSVKIYALVRWAHPVFILLCTRCALGVNKKELIIWFSLCTGVDKKVLIAYFSLCTTLGIDKKSVESRCTTWHQDKKRQLGG